MNYFAILKIFKDVQALHNLFFAVRITDPVIFPGEFYLRANGWTGRAKNSQYLDRVSC